MTAPIKHVITNSSRQRWRVGGFLSLLVAAAFMAGCTSMAPGYQRPTLPVSDAFPGDEDGSATQAPASAIGWAEYFTDPVLQRLIAQALDHNRDLRTATLQIEEARANYRIQRSDQLPAIGGRAEAQRGRTPSDLSPVGVGGVASQYQVELGLDAWELDFWGRVRSLKDAALQEFLATDQAASAIRLMLITDVAQSFYAIKGLNERITLAKRTIASHESAVRLMQRRFEVGAISRLDLVQSRTLLTQAQSLLTQLEQARAQQLNGLSLLVGASVEGAAYTQSAGASPMQQLQAGLPSDVLLNRPDIIAAEHRLQAANARIGAARAAFFPRITLTAGLGVASSELDGLFDSGSRAWRFMPSISLPIFDGERRQAGLDLAEVRSEIAVAQYEKAIQIAFREVADALAARSWLAQRVGFDEETLAAQSERVRLAQARYDQGAAAYIEVLDAQRELLSAQQQFSQTRSDLAAAQVALYGVLGGGTRVDAANLLSLVPGI